MRPLTIASILFILLYGCKKDATIYPDKETQHKGTMVLAHKAGGGSNNPYKENTLEAAVYGFAHLDGIETDVQKSRDGTLWLYHDEIIQNAEGKDKRIPGLTDEEIKDIIQKNALQINTLEEVLKWKQANNNREYISLDIKPWLPTRYSNTQGYLIELADEICRLSRKYDCGETLLAECENAVCLQRIREGDPGIACYLCTYGDYDKGAYRALKVGFAGLSFRYTEGNITKEQIEELHSKGLRIQLWTINDKTAIENAMKLAPDFIQTDNVKME